jgi:hypothetical protein
MKRTLDYYWMLLNQEKIYFNNKAETIKINKKLRKKIIIRKNKLKKQK